MKKIIIILSIFFIDRISKIYLINLQSNGIDVDFYDVLFGNEDNEPRLSGKSIS